MTQTTYSPRLPENVKQVIEPHLNKWAWLTPAWCHEVWVCWQANNDDTVDDATLTCQCEYQYRRITITVYPAYLDATAADKETDVVHELIHGFNNPLTDYVSSILKHLLPGEDDDKGAKKNRKQQMREMIDRQLCAYHEGMTEDLARCIYEHLEKHSDNCA